MDGAWWELMYIEGKTTADSFLPVVLLQAKTLTEQDPTGQVNIVNLQWIWVS